MLREPGNTADSGKNVRFSSVASFTVFTIAASIRHLWGYFPVFSAYHHAFPSRSFQPKSSPISSSIHLLGFVRSFYGRQAVRVDKLTVAMDSVERRSVTGRDAVAASSFLGSI